MSRRHVLDLSNIHSPIVVNPFPVKPVDIIRRAAPAKPKILLLLRVSIMDEVNSFRPLMYEFEVKERVGPTIRENVLHYLSMLESTSDFFPLSMTIVNSNLNFEDPDSEFKDGSTLVATVLGNFAVQRAEHCEDILVHKNQLYMGIASKLFSIYGQDLVSTKVQQEGIVCDDLGADADASYLFDWMSFSFVRAQDCIGRIITSLSRPINIFLQVTRKRCADIDPRDIKIYDTYNGLQDVIRWASDELALLSPGDALEPFLSTMRRLCLMMVQHRNRWSHMHFSFCKAQKSLNYARNVYRCAEDMLLLMENWPFGHIKALYTAEIRRYVQVFLALERAMENSFCLYHNAVAISHMPKAERDELIANSCAKLMDDTPMSAWLRHCVAIHMAPFFARRTAELDEFVQARAVRNVSPVADVPLVDRFEVKPMTVIDYVHEHDTLVLVDQAGRVVRKTLSAARLGSTLGALEHEWSSFLPTTIKFASQDRNFYAFRNQRGKLWIQPSTEWAMRECVLITHDMLTRSIILQWQTDDRQPSYKMGTDCVKIPYTNMSTRLIAQLAQSNDDLDGIMVRVFCNSKTNFVYAHCIPYFACELSLIKDSLWEVKFDKIPRSISTYQFPGLYGREPYHTIMTQQLFTENKYLARVQMYKCRWRVKVQSIIPYDIETRLSSDEE